MVYISVMTWKKKAIEQFFFSFSRLSEYTSHAIYSSWLCEVEL